MGNKGVIAAGDVQWMTAGSGIIHQEMPWRVPPERCGAFSSGPTGPRRSCGKFPDQLSPLAPFTQMGQITSYIPCGTTFRHFTGKMEIPTIKLGNGG
jgi:hypothetical protein